MIARRIGVDSIAIHKSIQGICARRNVIVADKLTMSSRLLL
jgi:hypothetical protein